LPTVHVMGWTGLSSDNWPVSEQFPVVAIQFFENVGAIHGRGYCQL
jgi:hypothetical protein